MIAGALRSQLCSQLSRCHSRSALIVLSTLIVGVSCSPSMPQPATQSRHANVPLFIGRPTEYIPAAGLRWLFLADIAELARDPRLLQLLEPLVSKDRIARFGQTSGFNLAQVKSLAIAGFDYSTLYVVETRGDNTAIEQRFIERLLHDPIVTQPQPELTTITGMAAGLPQRMVRLHKHLVAISIGDPTPARAVEAYARGRLKKSPTVFAGAAFASLPPSLAHATLLFFAPGPFKGEWAQGFGGLFQGALALAATAELHSHADLSTSAWLAGGFDTAPGAASRLSQGWEDLAQSSLGRLLGLHEPIAPPHVSERSDSLRLDVTLGVAPIVAGLHAAVAAEVWEFLNMRATQKPTLKPNEPPPAQVAPTD